MESIWTKSVSMPQFPKLEEDIRTQVLVIGGGLTGILCAYFLQQEGIDCCLLEKERICGGVTCNTTAKITSQQGLIYEKLLRKEGLEKTGLYLKACEQAKKQYQDLGWKISCDMEERDMYVYSRENREVLEKEINALGQLGHAAEFVESTDLPFEVAGALCVRNQLQFHPLKFAAAIAENLHIYENSGVREMKEYFALTESGSVAAQKVIIATHFPFINTRGSYYLKLHQDRAYVVAMKQAQKLQGMYVDAAAGGLSFRDYKDILIVGGASRKTGKTFRYGDKKELCGIDMLKEELTNYYPKAQFWQPGELRIVCR